MNIYGEPIFDNLQGGGVVDGDLEIKGDLALGGDLDMGGNDILNCGTLNYTALNPPVSGGSGDTTISSTELIVNPSIGDDNTGQRGDSRKPFETLAAAFAIAQDQDTIICHSGNLGNVPFAMSTKAVNIRAYGSGFNKTEQTFVSGVTFAYAVPVPSLGVRISGIKFQGTTTFAQSNMSGTTRFNNCSFDSVDFQASSYTGGHYFTDCFFNGLFILNSAFTIFSECSNSSAHQFQVQSGTLLIENWNSTCGYIEHFGGIVDVNSVQSFTAGPSNRAVYSNVIAGAPNAQGIVLRDCFLIDGLTPLKLEVVGTVSVFVTVYQCQITKANTLLTGAHTTPNFQSLTTGPMTQDENRMLTRANDPATVASGCLSLYSKFSSLYTKNNAGDVLKLSTQPEGGYTPNRALISDNGGNPGPSQFSVVEDVGGNEVWNLASDNPNITLQNNAGGLSLFTILTGGSSALMGGSPTEMILSFSAGEQIKINSSEIKLNAPINMDSNNITNITRISPTTTNFAIGNTAADLGINIGTVAIGDEALNAYASNVIGTNTAVGYRSGRVFNGAGENTFLGHLAGNGHLTGSGSTYIGAQTTDTLGNSSNQTVIGSGSLGDASNQVVLGSTTVTQIINSNTATCDLGAANHEFKDLYLSSTGIARISNILPASNLFTMMGGIYIGQRPVVSSGFVLTGSATVADTALETDLIGPASVGVGSLISAANSAKVGTSTRISFSGSFDNAGAGAANDVVIRIKLGTQVINTFTLDTDSVNSTSPWSIEAHYTVSAISVSGNIKSACNFTYQDLAARKGQMINTPTQLLDTTQPQDLSITAQWNTADVNNTITIDQFVSTLVYMPQ